MTDGVTLSQFRVRLDVLTNGAHLYANGNQQVSIRIEIRKQVFVNSAWVHRDLSQIEISSFRFREVGAATGAALPPGWTFSASRNQFRAGMRPQLASESMQIAEHDSSAEQTVIPTVENEQVFFRFLSTRAIETRNFVAEVTIDGLGVVSTRDNEFGFSPSEVQITATAPLKVYAHNFTSTKRDLLNEKIDGKKDTWWWLGMTFFNLPSTLPEIHNIEYEVGRHEYYQGTRTQIHSFQQGGHHVAGSFPFNPLNTSTISTTMIRMGRTANPSAHAKSFFLEHATIRAYSYADTSFGLTAVSSAGKVTVIDVYGTASVLYLRIENQFDIKLTDS